MTPIPVCIDGVSEIQYVTEVPDPNYVNLAVWNQDAAQNWVPANLWLSCDNKGRISLVPAGTQGPPTQFGRIGTSWYRSAPNWPILSAGSFAFKIIS